jgi:CRP-like cAMP-binding protein
MSSDARYVGPVERLIYLRTLPSFGALPPEELAHLARNTHERFFRRGSRLLEEGREAAHVYFIVEGTVSTRRGGRVMQIIEPPWAVGFLPVLSNDPEGTEARAESDVVALELSGDDLLDAMEDNFSLLEAGIRLMSKQLAELQERLESRGLLERTEATPGPAIPHPLDLVQRLVLLRRNGPFRTASLDPLSELARRYVEVRHEPGSVLWRAGDPSSWGLHLVHGVVACNAPDGRRSFRMGHGSVLGLSEALGRAPRSYDAIAETQIVGLRAETNTFVDMLEDNFDIGLSFMRFLATLLTRLYERVAAADAASIEAAQAVPGT